jgi:predicted NBD/HSP70 family sugar kinase
VNTQGTNSGPGHAFISYVREDAERVDRLQRILTAAGIKVWRDTANLWPGQDWKIEISQAISTGSLAFIACFSEHSQHRTRSYQNEELILAADQMRLRPPGETWIIPIRFADCSLPFVDLGAGRNLNSLQRIDMFGSSWELGGARLLAAVLRIIGIPVDSAGPGLPAGQPAHPAGAGLKPLAAAPARTALELRGSAAEVTHDVFLLYASSDVDIARRICTELEAHRYKVWWDRGKVLAGDGLGHMLGAIRECKYLLIVLSAELARSTLVRDELSAPVIRDIKQGHVAVVPILYENCPIPPGLEPETFLDFTRSPEDGLRRLVATLRGPGLPAGAGKETPAAVRPTLAGAVNKLAEKVLAAKQLYLATDLGGTKAYVSLMTPSGERLFDRKFLTQSHRDPSGLLKFLVTCVEGTVRGVQETTGISPDEINGKIGALGVAFAGPTDSSTGVVRDASNFQIKDYPLADNLSAQIRKPVFVANDANLGVYGEAWQGVARYYKNVLGIVVGTGIGGGIVIDGELYEGSSSTAGEIGHIVLDVSSPVVCGCGQLGCFEALASRRAIARDVHVRKRLKNASDVRWNENNLGSAELADLVGAGDPDAVEVVQGAMRLWGKAVFTLLNILNPDIVFFGGGFVRQLSDRMGGNFLEPVQLEAAKCMNSVYEFKGRKVPIVPGELDNPMLSGACLLAMRGSRARGTRADVIAAAVSGLAERDFRVLRSIYDYAQPTLISQDPRSDYHEDMLRKLRDRGLIATVNGLSFRRSAHVTTTALGRIVVEDAASLRGRAHS